MRRLSRRTDGAVATDRQERSEQTAKRKERPTQPNTVQEVIYDLRDAAEKKDFEKGEEGPSICISINDSKKAKQFHESPRNLSSLMGNGWSSEAIRRAVLPDGPKASEWANEFATSFDLESNQVSVKYDSVLVFVLPKGTVIPKRVKGDELPPRWMKPVISNVLKSKPKPDESAPKSPSRSPLRSKKKLASVFDICSNAINGELTGAEKEEARSLLKAMLLVLDGGNPFTMMSYGERTQSRLVATMIFTALATKMESDELGEAMACLWMGTKEDRPTGGKKAAADTSGKTAAGVATPLEPPTTQTSEPTTPNIGNPIGPIPDAIAKSITKGVRSAVKANGGNAVSLSPALKQAFGAMAAAQTRNFLESFSTSNVIEIPDAHENHKPIKVVVLPSASPPGNLEDEVKKGENWKYREFGSVSFDAMPPVAQVAVTISACDKRPDVIRERLKDTSLGKFRLDDETSNAIGVYVGLTSKQEKKLNRAMHHAKKVFFPHRQTEEES